jgi:hypothetical protein
MRGLLPLDDDRWALLAAAEAKPEAVVKVLRQIGAMARWDEAALLPSPDEPWQRLQELVYSQGDVQTSAYAVVGHLLAMAADRPVNDKQVAIGYAMLLLVCALPGASELPNWLESSVLAALPEVAAMSKHCLSDSSLSSFSVDELLGAYLFATGHVIEGIALTWICLESCIFGRCGGCARWNVLDWEDGVWSGDDTTDIHIDRGGHGGIDVIELLPTDLQVKAGPRARDLGQLEAVTCRACNSTESIRESVGRAVRDRVPVAALLSSATRG